MLYDIHGSDFYHVDGTEPANALSILMSIRRPENYLGWHIYDLNVLYWTVRPLPHQDVHWNVSVCIETTACISITQIFHRSQQCSHRSLLRIDTACKLANTPRGALLYDATLLTLPGCHVAYSLTKPKWSCDVCGAYVCNSCIFIETPGTLWQKLRDTSERSILH